MDPVSFSTLYSHHLFNPKHPTQEVLALIRALACEQRGRSSLVWTRFMIAGAHAPVTLFRLALCKGLPQIQLMDAHNEPQWPCDDGSGAL